MMIANKGGIEKMSDEDMYTAFRLMEWEQRRRDRDVLEHERQER